MVQLNACHLYCTVVDRIWFSCVVSIDKALKYDPRYLIIRIPNYMIAKKEDVLC